MTAALYGDWHVPFEASLALDEGTLRYVDRAGAVRALPVLEVVHATSPSPSLEARTEAGSVTLSADRNARVLAVSLVEARVKVGDAKLRMVSGDVDVPPALAALRGLPSVGVRFGVRWSRGGRSWVVPREIDAGVLATLLKSAGGFDGASVHHVGSTEPGALHRWVAAHAPSWAPRELDERGSELLVGVGEITQNVPVAWVTSVAHVFALRRAPNRSDGLVVHAFGRVGEGRVAGEARADAPAVPDDLTHFAVGVSMWVP